MATEIERKFLVKSLPKFVTEEHHAVDILQGYITKDSSDRQVRIRSKGDKFYLTVKDRGFLEREEVEIEISDEQFHTLWPLTQDRNLRKKRIEVPYGIFTIEVDVFEGKLVGLVLAEVEFPSVQQSKSLVLPPWFDIELTEDARYTNSQLANSQQIPEVQA